MQGDWGQSKQDCGIIQISDVELLEGSIISCELKKINQSNSKTSGVFECSAPGHYTKIEKTFDFDGTKLLLDGNHQYSKCDASNPTQPNQPQRTQTLSYPHGTYVGEVLNGKANGQGTYKSSKSGTTYTGQFVNDSFNGIGTMAWTNGSKFVGTWKNDVGINGTITYADGRKEEGTVQRGIFKKTSDTNVSKNTNDVLKLTCKVASAGVTTFTKPNSKTPGHSIRSFDDYIFIAERKLKVNGNDGYAGKLMSGQSVVEQPSYIWADEWDCK